MQSFSSVRPVSSLLFGSVGSALKVSVRHGGGGGRPGAKPTFNWKERLQLQLDGKKRKEFKVKPIGYDEADLMQHFDASRGDMRIDITNIKNWVEPELPVVNKYKVVDIASLYGSTKPAGMLVREYAKWDGPFKRRQMSKGRPL